MKDEVTEYLIEQYPFLKVKNPGYSCTWTNSWLDELEPGWKAAFGLDFCKELAEAIKKDNCEDKFEFLQIKEKFAELRVYYSGGGPEVRKVIAKYEELSRYICGRCGQPATKITRGWYYPLCDACIQDVQGGYSPIWSFYNFPSMVEVQKEVENIKTNFNYEDYRGLL